GRSLVLAIRLAATAQQVLLGRRYAGDLQQEDEHQRRAAEGPPAMGAREAERDVGPPVHPLEEVVWVSRVAPQAASADPAAVARVRAKGVQLAVGKRFAAERDRGDQDPD